MINKKGSEGEIAFDYIIYTVLLVVFALSMFMVVNNYKSGGAVWEDFYAKEIVKVINNARVGDEITLDVHKATEIAKENEQSFSLIFSFDNQKNEVCVKLGSRKSCYKYFNEVDIIEPQIILAVPSKTENKYVNVLRFNVSEVQKKEVTNE
jgi:hypothetical protein